MRLNSQAALHTADRTNTFDWIMDVSAERGLKSAFHFICGCTDASKDADYELEHPAICHLMRRIYAHGYEIGLQPSYGSYQSPGIIVTKATRLRRIAQAENIITQSEWGSRMHYMRWEQSTTLQAWEQASMSYDSTLSYTDRLGFGYDTFFEYSEFDPMAGKVLKLRIRPLIATEGMAMVPRYMGLGSSEAVVIKFAQLKNA